MITFKEDIEPIIRQVEEIIGLSFKVFIATAFLVTLLGIYIANLLFGNNSLQVLQNLRNEEKTLIIEIDQLKEKNAKLHKHYLEWTDAQ